MFNRKFLALALTVPLFLTACGGNDEEGDSSGETGTPGKILHEGSDYSIEIPAEWETVENGNFTSNVPAGTVAGFRNNIKNEIFTANINIVKKEVEEGLSTEDFGKSSLAQAKKRILEFNELESEERELNSQPGYFIEFEGKQDAQSAIVHFQQYFIQDNSNIYTLTSAYLPNEGESVVIAMEEMLNSFTLK